MLARERCWLSDESGRLRLAYVTAEDRGTNRRERVNRRRGQARLRTGPEVARCSADDGEAGAVDAEELLQVLARRLLGVAERCGGSEDAELRRVEVEPEPVQQSPQQHRYLGAGRPFVAMEFVNDEVEPRAVLLQVLRGLLEDRRLVPAIQHHVQHREVRDEDVRRVELHVWTGQQLGTERTRDVRAVVGPELLRLLGAAGKRAQHALEVTVRGLTGVAAEVEPVPVPLPAEPRELALGVEDAPHPHQLVLDERVHRVEDEPAHPGYPPKLALACRHELARVHPPRLRRRAAATPSPRLLNEVSEQRDQE